MKTDAVCFVGSKIETISLKKEVKVTTLYMTVKSWERRRYFLNEVIKSILTHAREPHRAIFAIKVNVLKAHDLS